MTVTKLEVKDPAMSRALQRLQQGISDMTPELAFEYVEVTFPSTADVDAVIPTRLRPSDPEDIYFTVVDVQFSSAPATTPCIYRDSASTRKPWNTGYVVLRCNVASVVATLRLFTRRTE